MRRQADSFRPVQASFLAFAVLMGCTSAAPDTTRDGTAVETVQRSKSPTLSDEKRQSVTIADRYRKAQAFQKANKHVDAFDVFRILAAEGHAPSAFDYARALDQGDGVPRDEAKARIWYKKAADLGSPRAHYLDGLTYANGAGVEQDLEKAARSFTEAAERGHAEAQVRLGRAYINGEGVERDVLWGCRWYDRAAVQGNANAEFAYAVQLASGKNIPLDLPLAAALMEAAEQNGNKQAGQLLPRILGRLSAEQRDQAAVILSDLYNAGPRGIGDRPTIRYVQKALSMLGINTGIADGWIGEKTRTGIRDFQSRIDVEPDGKVTPDLLEQLRSVLQSLQV